MGLQFWCLGFSGVRVFGFQDSSQGLRCLGFRVLGLRVSGLFSRASARSVVRVSRRVLQAQAGVPPQAVLGMGQRSVVYLDEIHGPYMSCCGC